jgi:hypothetical protein
MPCNYKQYPPNWKEIRARILSRANNKCEVCGVENGVTGYRLKDGSFISYAEAQGRYQYETDVPNLYSDYREIKIVLTIAHLDHDPENWQVKDERLQALCQKHHNAYDRDMRIANSKQTRNRKKGQMKLFNP